MGSGNGNCFTMLMRSQQNRVVAVLGPTNTGKTHLAMERMLGHSSGMIGFPLRLLARENYERAVALKGAAQVALITGEEKIIPPGARYFLCTTESLPVDRLVDFVALDEVQMCADAERGHVFTERLLNVRGRSETMLLGAETMRPILRALVPEAEYIIRPRFSTLSYTGQRKITRLPPRCAVVAFSAADVYSIAELVRRHRGGAAVVLGALSPRTRNAQVAMFQAGEVDYLIATDAIGMGLNMDVDHVAFAARRKFDGRVPRLLSAAEMAQIAGRAGRHMNDGTFGTTAEAGSLDDDTVARIESHTFDPLKSIFWRNDELNLSSVTALQRSLAHPSVAVGLVRAPQADDERVLAVLSQDSDIAALAHGQDAVRLLWDICRIPDFRKVLSDGHARLLGHIYRYLMKGERCLPTDWLASQVTRLDRVDGDIETLMQRIAAVRIWTYVSHRSNWLADPIFWQERTRAIEDRLSDALHDCLTQRFVDRRTAVLMGKMRNRDSLSAVVEPDGAVMIEGHEVGRLDGFHFSPGDGPARTQAGKAITNATRQALEGELSKRIRNLELADDGAFGIDNDGQILWNGAPVARVVAGPSILRPAVGPLPGQAVHGVERERLRQRLAIWLESHVRQRLKPLLLGEENDLLGIARGLVFELCEALGSMPRHRVREQLEVLDRNTRKTLRELGIRIGQESIYIPAMLKPAAIAMRRILWGAHHGTSLESPPPGRVSIRTSASVPRGYYEAIGYRQLGVLSVRVDIVERLAARLWSLSQAGSFVVGADVLNLLGCSAADISSVLAGLGYKLATGSEGEDAVAVRYMRVQRKLRPKSAGKYAARLRPAYRVNPDSPFAKLGELEIAR